MRNREKNLKENWVYRIIVILSLCVLLIYMYVTSEDASLTRVGGKFVFYTKTIWQAGILILMSFILFYLLESILEYKSQNTILSEYLRKAQNELVTERKALNDLKSISGDRIIELGSFIVTISDLAKELNSVLETNLLLRTILAKTAELLGSNKCAMFNVSGNKKEIILVESIGYDKERLLNLHLRGDETLGLLGLSLREGKFYSRYAVSDDYDRKYILESDTLHFEYCQPIAYGEKVLAVICVGDTREGLSDKNVIRILSAMANLGAVALTNTILVEKIKDQSIKDGLTGLYNHQYFQERLDGLLISAIASNKPLGLIMMDLDHFKRLNDNCGHQMGDAGLKNLANLLLAKAKGDDIIARYGGEEFVYASPGMNLSETAELAEEIRSDFKNTVIELEGVKTKCTLSAGVAAFTPDKTRDMKKNVLIRMADIALYEAKEKGRDRVVVNMGDKNGDDRFITDGK
ncbi:MAG: GGDEF domain-containing protein [Candidatus Omnitrophica bacterium]|nr:GGDEF domain-containing protein [Candidatus Omnitrophota bacterium]